jgi:hypothetical protein
MGPASSIVIGGKAQAETTSTRIVMANGVRVWDSIPPPYKSRGNPIRLNRKRASACFGAGRAFEEGQKPDRGIRDLYVRRSRWPFGSGNWSWGALNLRLTYRPKT